MRLTRATWCDGRRELDRLRILVLGAGVIGSVYAGRLLQAGHDVVILARGPRLVDLQTHGLYLRPLGPRGELCVRRAQPADPRNRLRSGRPVLLRHDEVDCVRRADRVRPLPVGVDPARIAANPASRRLLASRR